MVTNRFVLNKENIVNAGHTEQEIIDFLRRFYVTERKAEEVEYLVFQRDDEDAMCDLGNIISVFKNNPRFMNLFSKCEWDIDGEEENIIAEIIDYEGKHSR